jgi:hypothetical protein
MHTRCSITALYSMAGAHNTQIGIDTNAEKSLRNHRGSKAGQVPAQNSPRGGTTSGTSTVTLSSTLPRASQTQIMSYLSIFWRHEKPPENNDIATTQTVMAAEQTSKRRRYLRYMPILHLVSSKGARHRDFVSSRRHQVPNRAAGCICVDRLSMLLRRAHRRVHLRRPLSGEPPLRAYHSPSPRAIVTITLRAPLTHASARKHREPLNAAASGGTSHTRHRVERPGIRCHAREGSAATVPKRPVTGTRQMRFQCTCCIRTMRVRRHAPSVIPLRQVYT